MKRLRRAACLGVLIGLFIGGTLPAAEEADRLHRIDAGSPADLRELLRPDAAPLPFVSAHRGGAAVGYPENCIPTFEHTLRSTYAMLEIDPRRTKDGAIVVHHDETLERTTTGAGRVADHTLAELQQLHLKDRAGNVTQYRIPTLDEVIAWARGRTVLVLDQKDFTALERARLVTRLGAEAWVMLIVSRFEDVQAVHRLNPDLMMEVMIPNLEKARKFAALGVRWSNVIAFVGHQPSDDPALYRFIHDHGASCMIGTSRNLDRKLLSGAVSDIGELASGYQAFRQRGADIIETDIPVQLGRLLNSSSTVPTSKRKFLRCE